MAKERLAGGALKVIRGRLSISKSLFLPLQISDWLQAKAKRDHVTLTGLVLEIITKHIKEFDPNYWGDTRVKYEDKTDEYLAKGGK